MSQDFKFPERLAGFIQPFRDASFKENFREVAPWLAAWLISSLFLFYNVHQRFVFPILLIFFFFFSWIKFTKRLQDRFSLLPEFLLASFFLGYFLQTILSFWLSSNGAPPVTIGFFLNLFQIAFLTLLATSFGLLLLYKNQESYGLQVILFILGYFYHFVIFDDKYFLLIGLKLLVLFLLLNKTRWLEELTLTETWAYLMLFSGVLYLWWNANYLEDMHQRVFSSSWIWQSIPSYFHLLSKMYLLALVIRIPIVMIYNYASLARKLRVSGLLQSTVPQAIQFFVLMAVFYFFLSGWQGQYLQDAFAEQLEQLKSGEKFTAVEYREFFLDDSSDVISPANAPLSPAEIRRLPRGGSIRFTNEETAGKIFDPDDFYIFQKTRSGDTLLFQIARVDTAFLSAVKQRLRLFTGSLMSAFPFKPDSLDQWAYYVRIFDDDHFIRPFRFGILPYDYEEAINIPLDSNPDNTLDVTIVGLKRLTFGRIYMPLWEGVEKTEHYLGVDILLDVNAGLLKGGVWKSILLVGLLYLLINAIVIRRVVTFGNKINQMIIAKFNQLKTGIQEISTGNLAHQIYFEGNDEFVELGRSFNQMGERLKLSREEEREKDRLQFELRSARDVQIGLLPSELPKIEGYQVAAALHTATEVGGDFYDLFALDEHRFLFAIGDVSGKGSSAALYMAQCMSLIRFARQFTDDPGEICLQLNDYFASSVVDRHIFVTLILGTLDTRTNKVVYVRAGHTEPVFMNGKQKKSDVFLKSNGLGIGLTTNRKIFKKTLAPVELTFEPGATLVLYTDGFIEAVLPEQQNDEAEREGEINFDENSLVEILTENETLGAVALKGKMEDRLNQFYGFYPRVDDSTILILQRERR